MKKLLLILAIVFCLGCTTTGSHKGQSSRDGVWDEWTYIGGYIYCRTITIDNADYIVVTERFTGIPSIIKADGSRPLINIESERHIK